MKTRGITGCGIVAAAVMAAFVAGAEVGVGENIILNPGFESIGEPNPQYWNNESKFADSVVPANGMEPGAMPAVKFVGKEGNRGINLRQYGLRLKAGGHYRLSAKVRAKDFSAPKNHGRFSIANDKWRWSEGVNFPCGTYDWKAVETDFTAEPSQGGKYFAVIHAKSFSGTLEVAEAKLIALDEETRLGTSPSELAVVMTMPRLVPWATLIDEIPAEDPVVSFRFFGKLPQGAAADYDVKVACGDAANTVALAEGEIRIRLPQPPAKGSFTASIVRRADGTAVFSRAYNYALAAKVADPTPGRKLNNLVTEYFNENLAAGATVERRLALVRGGWTFVSAEAESVEIDGKAVIGPDTPRHETFRELDRGEHVIRVKGAKGGAFVVRGIPELFNYCTSPSVVKENPPFDWAFTEKYVLPGVTTLNGGQIHKSHVRGLKERGYIWLGNMNSRNIGDDDDLCNRLSKSKRINAAQFDGVTCDEQYLGQPDVISHYSAGLWKYVHPKGKRVYSWVVGKPAKAGVDHDFIAASVNATGGKGKLLTEYYCITKATEKAAADYVRDWLYGSIVKYDEFSPVYRPRYGIIFGNYTQVPSISLWGHAEVDYRYYLDMQFNLVANDPKFADVGCTGVWGSYYAEEEIHRWTFMLMRHYFIEGRRDMLSKQYGFKYISGHLVNGDFAQGLKGWKASGEVTTGHLKGMGTTSEGRRSGGDGCGDTYAVLKRGTSAATVKQRVKGLVPGKDYCLRYVVLDAKEIAKDVRGKPREYALKAVLPKDVSVRKDLSWSHVDERKAVKGSKHAPRANARHVVFTASSAEMDLVFTVADAQEGEELALNCVSVHPYLPR